jgi:Ca2+-binding EF-hand superfamily protein
MKSSLKIALLLGVVTFISGAGIGAAQSARTDQGPAAGLDRGSERGADRLLREFDLNKDGRVTQDEMNRTLGARFVMATHHEPKMSMDQFMAVRANAFRQYNEAMFRRLDWNGDGKLTLAEFAAPQRIRFVAMDRDGAGFIWCALRETEGNGRAGLSRFCTDNDLNMDGRVTRAELDGSISKRFALATGGAQSMTPAQFAVSEQQRFALANARTFRRLAADGDGMLTIREFADAELKLFARLDKNRDHVLAPTELRTRFARSGRSERRSTN